MGLAQGLQIAPEPADGADAQYCLAEYYRELDARFEGGFDPDKSALRSTEGFAPPAGVFLVVRLDGKPVGCGGFKPLGEAAYIKRMWIDRSARGLGLARQLLGALEDHARAAGYSTVCLETNRTLGEAQNLYRSSGYTEVRAFNDEPYAHHWFEKVL